MSAPNRSSLPPLKPAALCFADIGASLSTGWRQCAAMPGLSMAYAALFVVLGAILAVGLNLFR